jgi:hypothetical protein
MALKSVRLPALPSSILPTATFASAAALISRPSTCGRDAGDTPPFKRVSAFKHYRKVEHQQGQQVTPSLPSKRTSKAARHRHQEFLKFLKAIDQATPQKLDIHCIADNYATHKHPRIKAWLVRHPAFTSILFPPRLRGSTLLNVGSEK